MIIFIILNVHVSAKDIGWIYFKTLSLGLYIWTSGGHVKIDASNHNLMGLHSDKEFQEEIQDMNILTIYVVGQ